MRNHPGKVEQEKPEEKHQTQAEGGPAGEDARRETNAYCYEGSTGEIGPEQGSGYPGWDQTGDVGGNQEMSDSEDDGGDGEQVGASGSEGVDPFIFSVRSKRSGESQGGGSERQFLEDAGSDVEIDRARNGFREQKNEKTRKKEKCQKKSFEASAAVEGGAQTGSKKNEAD